MAIPLPQPPKAGGNIVDAMRSVNSLTNEMLRSRMQELENQYYAPKTEANIAHTQAQTNELNTMTPLRAAYQQLVNSFYGPNISSLINERNTLTPLRANQLSLANEFYPERIKAMINAQNALANFRKMGGGLSSNQQLQNKFLSDIRRDNPDLSEDEIYQASNAIRTGKNALNNGIKLNVSPTVMDDLSKILRGNTTASLMTQSGKANQAEAELGVLSKFAQEGLEPYGNTYLGKSPEQIMDTFKNDDKSQEKLGKFIASQAMQYEIAQIRNRLAGGEAGIKATEELMNLSGQLINADYPKLSYKARKVASDQLNKALVEGLKARNKVGLNPFISTINSNNEENNKSTVKVMTPDGETWDIPEDKVEEAIKRGAKKVS